MRGIAFIGGEAPPPEICRRLTAGADLVVAADSGLMVLEAAGLAPDWIVGDMDSLDDLGRLAKYPGAIIRRYPHDKDFTDTELALALLGEKGCSETWIIGGGGGRLDHILALRELFEREKSPRRWISAREDVRLVDSEKPFRSRTGGCVSVFPLGKGPWKAESEGLKWPLSGPEWTRGFFGVSNRAEEGEWTIRALAGSFLVVLPLT